jgi:hypothetical protein
MKFKDAVSTCHVRSSIFRTSDPTKIYTEADLAELPESRRSLNKDKVGTIVPKRYWKNHNIPLEQQVPLEDQRCDDWEEYDPRDDDDCSLFSFND